MRAASTDLILRNPLESFEVQEPIPSGQFQDAGPIHLDVRCLESLLLNLDASLSVHARTHFFSWTQGLLQSLIPHKVLICAFRCGEPAALLVDSFSTLVPDVAALGRLLLRDATVAPALIKVWMGNSYLPLICEAENLKAILDGRFRHELECIGATRLLMHGSADANGEASSFFLFACESAPSSETEPYLLQMLVPHLHAAWVCCQRQATTATDASTDAAVNVRTVTARERQVLKWIYRGKSNAEIAVILEISPLTVKNHVQHILRKLNVVNRAQAVGKALDARVIGT